MHHSAFVFNAIKHHLNYIRTAIAQYEKEDLYQEMLKIGASQMDLYIGNLTTEQLFQEIIDFLVQNNLNSVEKYQQQLSLQNDYLECTLSDNSRWTLRMGLDTTKFIHIHPSRYSPHSLRIKAGVLKTAIAVLAEQPNEELSTEDINQIRQKISLSPIKSLTTFNGFFKVLTLLRPS